MTDLKAAVIGCGGHAQSHFKMIADEPRLRLAGIAELDEERLRGNRAEWRRTWPLRTTGRCSTPAGRTSCTS